MVKRAWGLPMRRASAARLAEDTLPIVSIAEPERLVGLGFRYWLNGFRTGDIGCWEKAWDAYAGSLGPHWPRVPWPIWHAGCARSIATRSVAPKP